MTTEPESIDEVLLETTDKMEKAVAHTQSEFSTVRTGKEKRLSPCRRNSDTAVRQKKQIESKNKR